MNKNRAVEVRIKKLNENVKNFVQVYLNISTVRALKQMILQDVVVTGESINAGLQNIEHTRRSSHFSRTK